MSAEAARRSSWAGAETISSRLPTLSARRSTSATSTPRGSTLTTSAPRSASRRPASQPRRSVASTTRQALSTAAQLSPRLCQGENPTGHARLHLRDLPRIEEVLRLDAVHRVNRAVEVLLVAERHGGIDSHAAFEKRVRGGPRFLAGRQSLGGHEVLAAAAWDRIEDVGLRVHARGEAPHDVVHRIDVDIVADRDGEAHALRARQDRREEIALPAFFDAVALLHLNDAAAPVGHAVRDVHVLDDSRLEPVAQLEDRRFAHGGVD